MVPLSRSTCRSEPADTASSRQFSPDSSCFRRWGVVGGIAAGRGGGGAGRGAGVVLLALGAFARIVGGVGLWLSVGRAAAAPIKQWGWMDGSIHVGFRRGNEAHAVSFAFKRPPSYGGLIFRSRVDRRHVEFNLICKKKIVFKNLTQISKDKLYHVSQQFLHKFKGQI